MGQAAAGLIAVKIYPSRLDLFKRYGVNATPTVVFLDPRGNRVNVLRSRDTDGVRQQISEVVATVR